MKDLFDTPFKYEIAQVFEQGVVGPAYNYTLTIIANGVEIPVQAVISTHRLRDYINNYTDLFTVTFIMVQSDLEYKVKPYQDNLEAVLIRRLVSSNPQIQTANINSPITVARYKAVMTDSARDMIEQNDPFVKDKDVQGRRMSKPVVMQLIDPVVDKLRLITVATIPRFCTGMKAIETLLTKYSKEASNLAGASTLGLDIAPGWNEEVRQAIPLRGITRLTTLPNMIANNCGGIYPAGFSYYLQNRIWYLYPPFDPQRYFKVKKNLTIVNLPKDRIKGLEKSYKDSSTQLIFLSAGAAEHVDFSDQNQLGYGNGARFLDASRLTKMGTMQNNRYSVNASNNMNEIQTNERKDGLSIAFRGTSAVTTNKYGQLSMMAARMGSFVQLEWGMGDDTLIYPGMPVRFLYLEDNKPTEAFGAVSAVETYQAPQADNIAMPKLLSKTAVTIFINHPD